MESALLQPRTLGKRLSAAMNRMQPLRAKLVQNQPSWLTLASLILMTVQHFKTESQHLQIQCPISVTILKVENSHHRTSAGTLHVKVLGPAASRQISRAMRLRPMTTQMITNAGESNSVWMTSKLYFMLEASRNSPAQCYAAAG